MTIALDLTRRHFTHHRRDLLVIGTWLRTDDSWEPCLAILRAGSEYDERTVPCVVTMGNAWMWSDEVGDPLRVGHAVGGFLHALGMSPTTANIIRIRLLVNDHLDDLLRMPPWQPIGSVALAEVTLTNHSLGRTFETEMRQDV